MLRFWFTIFLVLLTFANLMRTYRVERMIQSTAIRGKFICGQKPAIGVRVKLFEQDNNLLNQPITTDEYMLSKIF
ncbi:hypothetical protein WUBG_16647 [Wuchereria bancrofti]|uniref:Uncharacterized protein n=1 Tax=Wuchereria bancrofti TaxID=6293 RepID=J9AEI5_WUCBA|nr:hypothetical protein WUBG_16647 [Wuchereria bancrofti]